MRIVILGAGGRLGTLLRPRWPGQADWLTRADADIEDPAQLAAALKGAEVVFCFAGVTTDTTAPMDLNISLAQKTLDAAPQAWVFLCSSAAVYGALDGPLFEDGPTAPLNSYAKSKLAMETMAAGHATSSTSLRLGNIAGADAILGNWRPGFRLDEWPDGTTPARSYIGPGRLARVLHDLAHADHLPATLNVAAPGAVEMGDLLHVAGLNWTARPATSQTIPKVHLNTDRLERLTSFAPSDSTAAGIVADWRLGCRI